MRWVTRERVKVDRVACPWLIRRFVDPAAEFVFLPHTTDWNSIDGIVFDTPGAELGHHGERVSFDAILDKYEIQDPAVRLMAEIVRAADTHPATPRAAGEGLRWIAHGFSALGYPTTRSWSVNSSFMTLFMRSAGSDSAGADAATPTITYRSA